ncbi:SnoaL-like domain-containing protein [Longibacter sp.]|jgi:ketosteroid isomerase-like protein|uniref:SnoaL-like domain-containing protein n=1 Tax=Longibacter sp. TaxID=2045415 RepID=UPI003EB8495F
MTYLERAKDLYAQLDQGNIMDAFERYYHENVVVVEADGQERHGKDAQRRAIEEWMSSVEEMHDGATEHITSNEAEGVTMVQSFTDVTIHGERMPFREIAVQEWEGDQIVRESFFYFVPMDVQQKMAEQAARRKPA